MTERDKRERQIVIEETRLEGDTYQIALDRYLCEKEIPPQIKINPEMGTKRFFDEVKVVKLETDGDKILHSVAIAREGIERVLLKDGEEVFSDKNSAGVEVIYVTPDYSRVLIFNDEAYHPRTEAVLIDEHKSISIEKGKNMKFHSHVSRCDLSKTVFSFNLKEEGRKSKETTTIMVWDQEESRFVSYISVDKSFTDPIILATNSDYSRITWEGYDKNERATYINEKVIASGEIDFQRFSRDGEQYFVVSKGKRGAYVINFNGLERLEAGVTVGCVEVSGDFNVGIAELVKDGKKQILAFTSGRVEPSPFYDARLDYHSHESDVEVIVRQNLVKKRFTFRSQEIRELGK